MSPCDSRLHIDYNYTLEYSSGKEVFGNSINATNKAKYRSNILKQTSSQA